MTRPATPAGSIIQLFAFAGSKENGMKKSTKKFGLKAVLLIAAGVAVVALIGFYLRNGVGRHDERLAEAATFGDVGKVSQLISAGANVNAKSHSPITISLPKQADTDDGLTPLFYAVSNRKTEVARFLLEHGADPNIATDAGNVPLLIAAASGDTTMVGLLLKHGAKPGYKNAAGDTPLKRAQKGAQRDPRYQEVVRMLTAAGAKE